MYVYSLGEQKLLTFLEHLNSPLFGVLLINIDAGDRLGDVIAIVSGE
jgi:hypothetical protein